jgi:hypothetical protein
VGAILLLTLGQAAPQYWCLYWKAELEWSDERWDVALESFRSLQQLEPAVVMGTDLAVSSALSHSVTQPPGNVLFALFCSHLTQQNQGEESLFRAQRLAQHGMRVAPQSPEVCISCAILWSVFCGFAQFGVVESVWTVYFPLIQSEE